LNASKRFLLRTYGCQMNVHDSEKVANLLWHHGYRAADDAEGADLYLINTCSVRGKAERQLYSDLGALRTWKTAVPGRVLGVGGCTAQQEGDALLRRFAHLDFVFGTHNLRLVPSLAEASRRGERSARIEESNSLERFDFPDRHPGFEGAAAGRGYLTVMEGCDLFCSFCIVPLTRGREISRPARAIMREAESLAARGVRELTLLGQTVNAYGRQRPGGASAAGTTRFAALLRRLAEIPGISRLRYTSPHPSFCDEDLVRAHGELPELCPHLHLPVQSGADAVLRRMRRRYAADDYRRLVDRLRQARPDIAITTDLIVGFPGETDGDFRDTLALVREVGFVDSFSFKFSPRPGTAAARAADGIPERVAQERLQELQALQRGLTLAAHRARVGERTEILVEGPSRRGGGQLSGRDPYHRVVNLAVGAEGSAAPGSLADVEIVEATPHSLIAELVGERSATGETRSVKDGTSRADEQVRRVVSGP
jgi:tRNA-2-methylthio-N6-dimethylallyladenosine synthase